MKKLSFAFLLIICACHNFPKDPEGSLKEVKGNTLYVGIVHHPPWTIIHDSIYQGIEVELVEGFAEELNADIEWVRGSETVLMRKLDRFTIHLIIGGFEWSSPWNKSAGFTKPYYQRRSMAASDGENAFILRLEKYLYQQQDEISRLIKKYEKYKQKETDE